MSYKYQRYENESPEELIFRICSHKNEIGTWSDVGRVLNELLGENYTESAYRKKYQSFEKMFSGNQKLFSDNEEVLSEISEQRRELEKEKIKFRDERNAWNKQNRIVARTEQKLDYLEEQLVSMGKVNFSNHTTPVTVRGNSDLLITISDIHYGLNYNNYFGTYNSDICKNYLAKYLEKIISIGSRHKARNIHVVMLGDIISGSIHKSIQIANRENVIEQIKGVSELLSSFVYELSNHFAKVTVTSVSGNHSRLDKKDEALHDERLDDIVSFIMEKSLSNVDNISFQTYYNFDTSIASIKICGKLYFLVHGDYDTPNETGVMRLCSMVGNIPYAIVMGHRHSAAYNEINGIVIVQSGCLCGSGDDYTIQKRLSGLPSQTICVCSEHGIDCMYPVKF